MFAFMGLLVFYILFLLVPAPLVDLALGQSSYFGHFYYFLFSPIHLTIKFLLEHFNLDGTFSLAFFNTILVFPHTLIGGVAYCRIRVRNISEAFLFHTVIFFLHDHVVINIGVDKWGTVLTLTADQLTEKVFFHWRWGE